MRVPVCLSRKNRAYYEGDFRRADVHEASRIHLGDPIVLIGDAAASRLSLETATERLSGRPIKLRLCRSHLVSAARLRDRVREQRLWTDKWGFARDQDYIRSEKQDAHRRLDEVSSATTPQRSNSEIPTSGS